MSRLIDIDKAKEHCNQIADCHTRLAIEVLRRDLQLTGGEKWRLNI